MGSLATSDSKRICVVGAGALGLVAIKYLNQYEGLVGTVFEQMDRVSGLWHYVEDTEKDANRLPVHSAVYPSLHVIGAKELMQFRDFEFPDYEDGKSFVCHESVEKYLNAYADKFNVRKNIQLNSKVLSIVPIQGTQRFGNSSDFTTKWSVEVFNYKTNVKEEHIFDGIIVANGKFSEPIIPEIKGSANFEGKVLHTQFYRHPEVFKDQHVVIFGLGSSALEIGTEIADFAKTVAISHRTAFKLASKKMTIVCSPIAYMKEKSVVLENGDELPCDTLILATGYNFSFPFLHEDCGVTVEEGKYVGLYRHVHCPKYPTLCLPNLFSLPQELKIAEIQVQYLAKYFQGVVQIPHENERRKAIEFQEAEWNSKNVPVRHRFKLRGIGLEINPYLVSLAHEAGGLPEITRNLDLLNTCIFVGINRFFGHRDIFRKDRFTWIDSHTAKYYCYADAAGKAQPEVLTLELDERTGTVNITSSLGEIQNKPFGH